MLMRVMRVFFQYKNRGNGKQRVGNTQRSRLGSYVTKIRLGAWFTLQFSCYVNRIAKIALSITINETVLSIELYTEWVENGRKNATDYTKNT